jgi:nucleotide-binding universal stress UspA family protein
MFTHILIPTDGSELSLRAARASVQLAKALNARVTSVHVYPARFFVYYGELVRMDDRLQMTAREACRKEGGRSLDEVDCLCSPAGIPYERVLLEGENPWSGIIDTAERKRCDLIVMAAHGRRGLSALMLGSETNKVLTHSKIPVLVYR